MTTSPTRRRHLAVVGVITAALLAAACGGSDGGSADGGTATTSSADDTATDDTATDDTADAGAETTAPATTIPVITRPADVEGKATITWFIGLGTGTEPDQKIIEDRLVAEFNAANPDINLVLQVAPVAVAPDALATAIAGGNAPDVVGPNGIKGADTFPGQWLDLSPVLERNNVDLSKYPEELLAAYKDAGGSMLQLPYGVYPTGLIYNKDLFDEADLPYPPAAYGDMYGEGTEYEGEWTVEKMTEIARILTVDSNGNDETSPDFDRAAVEQWGFVHQWVDEMRAQGTFFGAGSPVGEDGNAHIPPQWVEEYKWYAGLMNDGVSPNSAEIGGDVMAGNPFASGKVAMAVSHLWYTCCINDGGTPPTNLTFWDVAAVPSYNGVTTAKLHADSFQVSKDTQHPDEALRVILFLQSEAALDLYTALGVLPADPALRTPYLDKVNESFPQGVNWDVWLDGLNYVDVPNHEAGTPAYVESQARMGEFNTLMAQDPTIDIDAEIADLEADLTALWARDT